MIRFIIIKTKLCQKLVFVNSQLFPTACLTSSATNAGRIKESFVKKSMININAISGYKINPTKSPRRLAPKINNNCSKIQVITKRAIIAKKPATITKIVKPILFFASSTDSLIASITLLPEANFVIEMNTTTETKIIITPLISIVVSSSGYRISITCNRFVAEKLFGYKKISAIGLSKTQLESSSESNTKTPSTNIGNRIVGLKITLFAAFSIDPKNTFSHR